MNKNSKNKCKRKIFSMGFISTTLKKFNTLIFISLDNNRRIDRPDCI